MLYNILSNILKNIAKSVINKNKPKIIAITGSAGKTSTKEVVFYVLQTKYGNMVRKSMSNLNNEIGVPLAILGYSKSSRAWEWPFVMIWLFLKYIGYISFLRYPEILVLEYGADKPGDIKYLTDIARPDFAIVTSIGPAHLQKFKTLSNIQKEKMSLAKLMQPEGIAILNEDNKLIKEEASRIYFEKKFYHGDGMDGCINAAKCVALLFNINKNDVEKAVLKIKPLSGRGEIIKTKSNIIIDDTYNSNPLSAELAIDKMLKLAKEHKNLKKIIVFGDMRELGKQSSLYHKEIYSFAKKNSDKFYTVGNEFASISTINNFINSQELANEFENEKISNSIILVKGSRTMEMEQVVKVLIK
jgi:UDP-N-acetylmuramoyl-tripeptide--D-alanyl-D-alanine ligase